MFVKLGMPGRACRFFLFVLLLQAATTVKAFTLQDRNDPLPLDGLFNVLEDASGTLSYDQVARSGDRFVPLPTRGEANFGYSSSAYWLRVEIETPSLLAARDWLVEIPFPTLDEVDFYLRSKRSGTLLAKYETGDTRPFSSRPLAQTNFAFPLALAPDEKYELYFRVRSSGNLTATALLWKSDPFARHNSLHYVLAGCFLGLLMGLGAYNLLLFLSLRENTYLFYVLFCAATSLALGAWDGLFFEYLWPNAPAWGNVATLVGFNAANLFAVFFTRSFLNTAKEVPVLDRALLVCAAVFAALIAAVPFFPYSPLALLTSAASVTFSAIALASGAYRYSYGFLSARYFLGGWMVLWLATALLVARNFNLLPSNQFTLNIMPLGSALSALLLSLALSERIHVARRQKEAAEEANRAKDEFLATVSHEIRTPLTVLLGSVTLLQGSPLQPRQALLARSAKRSGEQLLNMVNDLIDLSRMATGQLRLEVMPFNAGALIREVVELVEPAALDKGLAVKVRVGFPRLNLLGDQGRIRQVLLNLVFNAIKFTDRGEIRIEAIMIERMASRVTIRFSVNDTGIGIKPSDQEKLFLPFSQLDAHHPGRGSGLGLAISRRLIEAMGGTIRVFSRPGQGSRFWFDLDLFTASEPIQIDEKAASDPQPPRLKLLVVDDVDESREVLAAQLSHAGHAVTAAASGAAALEILRREQNFELVLMDVHMPGMDGYETVRALRREPYGKDLLIFALTADITLRTQMACNKAGMQGVVAKPLRMNELNSKLLAFHHPTSLTSAASADLKERETPLLDAALLSERLSLLGVEGVGKVIRVFMGVADQRVTAVTEAFKSNDLPACARAAHILRGSAGAVGLPALLELSGTVEWTAQEQPDTLAPLIKQIPETMQQSVAALEEWCIAHGVVFETAPVQAGEVKR